MDQVVAVAVAAAAPRDALPASVQPVSGWALANALAFMLHSSSGVELKASTPGRWIPWLTAVQAAAAGLALLLPAGAGRRSRLFLASAALAATFANHYMYLWLVDLAVAADPAGHHLLDVSADVAVRFFAVADFIALVTLVEGDLGAAIRVFLSRNAFDFLMGEIIRYHN